MFTKRHYEAVARVIRKARERAEHEDSIRAKQTEMLYGIGTVEAEIATMFAADNPAFDSARFAVATGRAERV